MLDGLRMSYPLIGLTIFATELGLPELVMEFARLPRGLVLVTGPTGSGKSTTLASLVDVVNTEREVHVMTVEDPIEYLHQHKTAVKTRSTSMPTPRVISAS